MVNVNKIVEILKKTEPNKCEDEDLFAYYDRETEEFHVFFSQEEYELETNERYPTRLEELLDENERLKELHEYRNDETRRYVYIKSPLSQNQFINAYIDKFSKDHHTYAKLTRSFTGYARKAKFRKCLKELNLKEDFATFCYDSLKNIAVKWCLRNNIEYEK